LWSVVFDANDHGALAKFWSAALGWHLEESDGYTTVRSDDESCPRLEFVPAPGAKAAKNRIHIDLVMDSAEAQAARVGGLLELGASDADIGQHNVAWNVLADPEGNEFCVSGKLDYGDTDTGAIAGFSFDAVDPSAQGRFWSAATGWDIVLEGDWGVGLRSPDGTGPFLTFWPSIDPKRGKNRLHIDVAPYPPDSQGAEVARLETLGGRRIDIGQGDVPWVVLADPEANEFCVLTPR
jgi:predicted enzyme related to lactoylglutathione lyase